ncbi:hypothetical protein SPI_01649 [Niveomyces insectorum RCEF 264]|uniref:Uncharacterized protein n=1 Tax=Niveomyces insectorum RCEF 264 TaxID=1081102 RepID=A0A167Z4F2_9HYPO|nr:hypothetical protein SPI_01649 [Niveomyces insectorum RCEF 264]
MSRSDPSGSSSRAKPATAPQQLPPGVAAILGPSLQVGFGAGTVGLFVGAASGIVRSAAPVLFSLVTGAQCTDGRGQLTGDGPASRATALAALAGSNAASPTAHTTGSRDKVKASALGGASAGFVGGLLRGPRNVLPALAVCSLFGAGGQAVVNALPSPTQNGGAAKTSWLDSKWIPVEHLSDEEYAKLINDKMLRLKVEMAMIDDNIAKLKAAKEEANAATKAPPTPRSESTHDA